MHRKVRKVLYQKGFIEGMNLHNAKHVSHVEFNNISDCVDYCFIRGEVVPQGSHHIEFGFVLTQVLVRF